jgi:hypothetical protein
MDQKTQNNKTSILPKLICVFNTISVKIPVASWLLFSKIDKLIQSKESTRKAKTTKKKKES